MLNAPTSSRAFSLCYRSQAGSSRITRSWPPSLLAPHYHAALQSVTRLLMRSIALKRTPEASRWLR